MDRNRLLHFWLRSTAAACLIVYLGWNGYWLAQAHIPPALFQALSGLPAPTTGGVRSVRQLRDGNWRESLRCNAMTLPMCLLLVLCVGWLSGQRLRGCRLALPNWLVWSWLTVLGLAWLLKLAGDPRYW